MILLIVELILKQVQVGRVGDKLADKLVNQLEYFVLVDALEGDHILAAVFAEYWMLAMVLCAVD